MKNTNSNENYTDDKFTLRPVKIEDARLLYKWRNDEECRRFSFNTDPIRYEEHLKWLEDRLSRDDCLMLIFCDEVGEAGQVRYDIDKSEALLSYSIDKRCRGKGYAGIMLTMASELLYEKCGELTIKAEVLSANAASLKVFNKLGYAMEKKDDHYVFYHKTGADA